MDRQTETGQNRNIGYEKLAIRFHNIPQPTQGGALQHCHQLCKGREDALVQWMDIYISTGLPALRFPKACGVHVW